MILQVCSIKDSASDLFGRPFYTQALGQATRSFRDEVNRKELNNDLNKHPDDFTLYHLGSFDDNSGRFTVYEEPRLVVRGKDVINPEK